MSVNYAKLFQTVKEFPARLATDIQGEPFLFSNLLTLTLHFCYFAGEIPKWVKGTLLKNGPGIFEVGQDKYNHWFDGLAILQSFSVENGKVPHFTLLHYRNVPPMRVNRPFLGSLQQ